MNQENIINNKDIEKIALQYIKEMEQIKEEEQQIINDGAMHSIFNNLININNYDCKFFWNDEFDYYEGSDKEQKRLLGRQIYIIANKVFNYFNKYNISFDIKTDNIFLDEFAIFKYDSNILYAKKMNGQGTCVGIGILNEFAIEKYGIENIDESTIVDIEDILNDKPFIINNPIYQNILDREVDNQLNELISNYGFEKVKERLNLLQEKDANYEKNN